MTQTESIMIQAYRVTGMTCAGCVRAVTNAIKARAPSADISVNLVEGIVTVSDAADPAVVEKAVAEAGFGFGGRV
jgi:copper chaperone